MHRALCPHFMRHLSSFLHALYFMTLLSAQIPNTLLHFIPVLAGGKGQADSASIGISEIAQQSFVTASL